jgi:hypothetical protein
MPNRMIFFHGRRRRARTGAAPSAGWRAGLDADRLNALHLVVVPTGAQGAQPG